MRKWRKSIEPALALALAPALRGICVLGLILLLANFGLVASARAQQAVGACADISAFGADRTGKKDSADAFESAAATAATQSRCIYLPAGTFRFASSPVISLGKSSARARDAVMIKGDGAGVTRMVFDAGISGLAVYLNGPEQSVQIRDFSIIAAGSGGATTGLSIIQANTARPNPAPSSISGVVIQGGDGFGLVKSFSRAIYLHQVSNMNISNTTVSGAASGKAYADYGHCLEIDGSKNSVLVQFNIIGSQFNWCKVGLYIGDYVQGIQIVATNFVGNEVGIFQPQGSPGNDQIAISASQFNCGEYDILLQSPIDGVTVSASDFYLSDHGTAAIRMPGVQFAIQANAFIQLGHPAAVAVSIGPHMLDAGIISGNIFKSFLHAVRLDVGSQNVSVGLNAYSGSAADPVLDEGSENLIWPGKG